MRCDAMRGCVTSARRPARFYQQWQLDLLSVSGEKPSPADRAAFRARGRAPAGGLIMTGSPPRVPADCPADVRARKGEDPILHIISTDAVLAPRTLHRNESGITSRVRSGPRSGRSGAVAGGQRAAEPGRAGPRDHDAGRVNGQAGAKAQAAPTQGRRNPNARSGGSACADRHEGMRGCLYGCVCGCLYGCVY